MDQKKLQEEDSPLRLAASQGNFNLVKELYDKTPELVEATDYRRRSALHFASARGYTEIARLLVSNDDLDMCSARDVDGRNPLHLAAMNSKVDVLITLAQKSPHAAEARAGRGGTILHICFKYNQKEALKLLLLANSKFQELANAKDDDGNTVLHLVVADQNTAAINLEIVKCLLVCPKINVNATNSHRETPLDVALEYESRLKKLKAAPAREVESCPKIIAELQVNALRDSGGQTVLEPVQESEPE